VPGYRFAGQILIEETAGGISAFGYPTDPDFTEPICLFLHGYNTDRPAALRQMDRLVATAQAQGRVPDVLRRNAWGVMWPGFAKVGFVTAAWSWLTYSQQLATAREAGRQLADYLLRKAAPRRCQVMLLAHSLGCRVALETLANLRGKWPASNVPLAILMAAAVPLDLLRPGEPLRSSADMAERTVVLFSYRDDVLMGPFKIGQTLSWDGGFLPEAVGATGLPEELWTESLETENDHSGYFDDDYAASAVMRSLGAVARRTPPTRTLRARWPLERSA